MGWVEGCRVDDREERKVRREGGQSKLRLGKDRKADQTRLDQTRLDKGRAEMR